MTRLALCLALAVGWVAYRQGGISIPRVPGVQVAELVSVAQGMTPADRGALEQTYAILARTIAANPAIDPVFPDTGSVRRAHRAALLAVWRGVLGNQPGKYPGLREALEGVLSKTLGDDDVALSPPLQEKAVAALTSISQHFR